MSSKVRVSASVLLAKSWEEDEVYLVLRGIERRAFPGTWVFPGGKVDSADGDLPVRGRQEEVATEFYVAAARELFEETGVLLAVPRGDRPIDPEALPELRKQLLAEDKDFRTVLDELDAELDGSHLVPLGEKTTPPFHPRRFKNRFFLAILPEGQEPRVIPGELDEGRWFGAADAADRFHAGELLLSPPILLLCERWGEGSARAALPKLRSFDDSTFQDRAIRIRFSPEVILFPGRTETVPPATHTNTYLVGAEKLLLVDPATTDPKDQPKLLSLIDELSREGRDVEAVVLTHHHPDHIGGTRAVLAHTDAPLWAHEETIARLPDLGFDRALKNGDRIELGTGGVVRVMHTPGHAPGHIVLLQEKHRAIIAGDMVSTASTILIDPDDGGDMAEYLESLEKMKKLRGRVIHPSHGDAYPDANRLLETFLEHRAKREQKVLAALGPEPRSVDELVPVAYADTAEEAWPLAKISLRAGLIKLEDEGRARRSKRGWTAA